MINTPRQQEGGNEMVNWQVAPADWEISNYDKPKVLYRKQVATFLSQFQVKSLKKKTFVTIACNVLCADIASSNDTVEPAERDIYLPLEIALTRWSVAESNTPAAKRKNNSKVWIINPGRPITGSNKYAMDQRAKHKIDYTNILPNDNYFRTDFVQVVKEINSMLTADRTVFSTQLRNCRQDLGCLKWLNRAVGFKMKPIKVYSLEDLYVVLIRELIPADQPKDLIGQGIARYRMEYSTNTYDSRVKCDYHKDSIKEDEDNDTGNCALALAQNYSNVLLNDISYFLEIFAILENNDGQHAKIEPTLMQTPEAR